MLTAVKPKVINGVDVDALDTMIAAIKANPEIAKFNFRAVNRWMGGDKNRSTIKEFTGALAEQREGVQAFVADNGEHPVLLGHDEAPNPIEWLLHAMIGCMTTATAYHAAAAGISISAIDSEIEGDLDLRGFLGRSERITWRVEDVIGEGKSLDFSKPFMPDSLVRVEALSFLSKDEKRMLNQIRGHAYLTIFGIIEEFIVPFVLDHARPFINGEDYRARAFLEFVGEEAKHIHLFRRFREEFKNGFKTECKVIGPAADIGKEVLSHHPLSVALAILMIEWMTQRHFQESIHDDGTLDPQFKSMLKHHWMEEMQHAQLDTLMVENLALGLSQAQIDEAIDGFLAIGMFLDNGLKAQTELDLDALEMASGRVLSIKESEEFLKQQHQANRWTYLGTGLSHKNFLETLGQLSPEKRKAVEAATPTFS